MSHDLQRIQDSTNYLKTLDTHTQKILLSKKEAPALKKLNDTQRIGALSVLMVKISVITGWQIPSKEIKDILVDQFDKLMMEFYPMLNVVEIENAFRRYGTKLPDWGKEMNLSLITAVLDIYIGERAEAERKANQGAVNTLKSDLRTDDDLKNEARAEIEFYYQQILKGNKRPLTFPFWAEVLKEDGFIQEESQMENFFTFCLNNSVKNIYTCENVNSL